MEKEPLSFLLPEEDEGSYLEWLPQVEHDEAGTQRSDEPVSKSMVKLWAGLPMETLPVQRRSFSWSVSSTLPRFWRDLGRVARGLISAPLENAWRPTFFSRLMRFWRCLLQTEAGGQAKRCQA